MIEALGADRILFGSGWPYYPICLPLVKVFLATEGMLKVRRKILYDNARALLEVKNSIAV